jgi:hypothetical protein
MSQTPPNKEILALYDELDRIEELVEDMIELKISSKADAERRIDELNSRIDQLEEAGS